VYCLLTANCSWDLGCRCTSSVLYPRNTCIQLSYVILCSLAAVTLLCFSKCVLLVFFTSFSLRQSRSSLCAGKLGSGHWQFTGFTALLLLCRQKNIGASRGGSWHDDMVGLYRIVLLWAGGGHMCGIANTHQWCHVAALLKNTECTQWAFGKWCWCRRDT
jgi:hypothetical protein